METVIGVGGAGGRIAEQFALYPQYNVYKIDHVVQPHEKIKTRSIGIHSSPELYEHNCPDLSEFFKDIRGEILFIVSSSGKISGASLRILHQLKHCKLNVMLILPNSKSLNNTAYLQHKVVYNVFQEYARSGVLNKLYLVSNDNLEDILGDISFLEYEEKMNKLLVDTVHYINYCENSDALLSNSEPLKETSKIATFGIHNIDSGEEKSFFNLRQIYDKMYYFSIDKNRLNTDGKLIRSIREKLASNEVRPSYQIRSSEYNGSYSYYVSYSADIQPLDN